MVEHLLRPRDVQLEASLEVLAYPPRDALRARDMIGGHSDGDPTRVRHDANAESSGACLGRDGGPLGHLDVVHGDRLF